MSRSIEVWLDQLMARDPNRIEPGVERTRRIANDLLDGRPSACVISVAGTNGKGSSVMMAESICAAAGYRVGSYTSPHLTDVRERFRVAGREVEASALIGAFERIDVHPESGALTYFEWLTVAAFLVFERAALDVWVLEVGLGGRLDAVNALDADLALITPIGLDHQAWLGETRDAIGGEKAGILRPRQPAVYSDPSPVDSVEQAARRVGADLWILGRDYHLVVDESVMTASVGCLERRGRRTSLPLPRHVGTHQWQNAASVVALLQHPGSPLVVPDAAVATGLAALQLAGRLERRCDRGRSVWFDVAHNTEAADALAAALSERPPTGRRLAVFSAFADKPIEALVRPLAALIDGWWIAPLTEPRAAEVGRIESALVSAGACRVQREADLSSAYNAALIEAGEGDELVVFGSFHVVGPLRARLDENENADA
ncbi:MAG: bifunctional folylpolyglutamate synthase/dihydrofolate synthase [Halothiobacillaceae bacterium]|nr:bifunctional folylpolyglutamate synthase/dihydrofolate synthase [Halothiobacillaceae bacterium]HER19865.1 bifunctional folylpolyglutamate synthase/dihydrofolate synthase [Chromatiales bacterium]